MLHVRAKQTKKKNRGEASLPESLNNLAQVTIALRPDNAFFTETVGNSDACSSHCYLVYLSREDRYHFDLVAIHSSALCIGSLFRLEARVSFPELSSYRKLPNFFSEDGHPTSQRIPSCQSIS